MASDELKNIGKIKKKLYSKRQRAPRFKRKGLRKRETDVSSEWQKSDKEAQQAASKEEPEEESASDDKEFKKSQIKVMPSVGKKEKMDKKSIKKSSGKKHSKIVYLLIFSVVFFLAAAGVGYISLIETSNFVSSEKVDIAVAGPPSAEGGTPTSFSVAVTNNNSSALEVADLILEFPKGTRSVEKGRKLEERRVILGTIAPGETVAKSVEVTFFGKRGEEKKLKTIVEYRIEGSNAIFSAEKTYPLTISSSPLNVSVDALDEVISGEEIQIKVTVSSNSDSVVDNVVLKVDYPFGFEFKNSNIASFFGDKIWKLGDIPSGGEKVLKIVGEIQGQEAEERVFKFKAGAQSGENNKKLSAALAGAEAGIEIKRPFLGVEFAFNGERTSNFVAQSGEDVRVDLMWSNNTPSKLYNVRLSADLEGKSFRAGSVSAESGFYNSSEKKVIWDKSTMEQLEELTPGEEKRGTFDLTLKELGAGEKLLNPKVPITVNVAAQRSSGSGRVPERVNTVVNGVVKISTLLDLTSRAVYSTGPFENSGPIPPKAEEQTTYTVLWTLRNSSNDVENTKVSASLPSFVEWMGRKRVSTGEIRYKPVGGEVEWDIGEIPADSRAEAKFQISLTPSVTQVDTSPNLISSQEVSGFDKFTETQLRHYVDPRTTEITTDPIYKRDDGIVRSQ